MAKRATEAKSVQFPILKYANEIGWKIVSRNDAETRRGFDHSEKEVRNQAMNASRFFIDLLFEKVKQFNPKFKDSQTDLIKMLDMPLPTIQGSREFLNFIQGSKTFYSQKEKRDFNLTLIDFDNPKNNVYEVTQEYYYTNGQNNIREDVVFLINGIPVVVVECKNATNDEALALGIDQLRRYHDETPEIMIPEQLFTATESIGFSYGVTWNTIRKNIFNWKSEQIGNLEAKTKTFFNIQHVLDLLKKFILFAEQDGELQKFILRQHQKAAVDKVVERALSSTKKRGLVWHTQGSGKTYTMIKIAELLFKTPKADKPTILLLIDRNELEDQMMKNLVAVGVHNVKQADSIEALQKLLKSDFRGIILSMVHKFRDMPSKINTRHNIYVLIDEAHRTTGGDLGNYLMAALENASFIGFTGTPVDKTAHGKGTFKTFGIDDKQGYLHKYSISESIKDGTTLPLFYGMAPNELLVPKQILDKEFLSLAEAQGISDIDELNKILDRAVNTKNFLKADKRVKAVAEFVAKHYKENVEPLGYKAFLVGVDRPACAKYKKALDKFLPKEYSAVVYTGSNNDTKELKEYHLDSKKEKDIRKKFAKVEELPKILIVTEKLLTGYDAPALYAMYLDKPMRDHTLLQAIARVNRPYVNEEKDMTKPHGFVLDFVGIFENLEKALAFDSDDINAIIKDIKLLKLVFKNKMDKNVPKYLKLVKGSFTDKDTDNLINHFRNKSKRKEFFKLYKEVEMLYEIISPDKFLRPYIDKYITLTSIYHVVRNAYSKRVMVDREFQRKTNKLIQEKISGSKPIFKNEFFEINENTISKIKETKTNDNTKIINLIKSIEKIAEENADDPFLIGMKERAEVVENNYEDRQLTTKEALEEIQKLYKEDLERKKEQAQKGFDAISFYVYKKLQSKKVKNPDTVTKDISKEFAEYPNWKTSDKDLRELRKQLYYVLIGANVTIDFANKLIEELFSQLFKENKK